MSCCELPAPSLNPRKAGWCDRCGRQIATSEPLRRVLELERDLTRQAAKGLVDPDALITHAETRSLQLHGEYTDDPMFVQAGRDLRQDAREEAADVRNYLVWWLTQNPEHEDRQRMFYALRHCCLIYDLLKEDE